MTFALILGLFALGPLIYVGWRRPIVLVVLLLFAVAIPIEVTFSRPVEGTVELADLGSFFVIGLVGARALLRLDRSISPLLAALLGAALTATTVATFFAPDAIASLGGLGRFTQMLIFVPLATYLAIETRDDQRLFLGALIALGLLESAVAVHQFATGTGASFSAPGATEAVDVRAFGTFDADNIMALPIVVSAALLAAFAIALWSSGRTRILALISLVPLSAGLLASLSRGAWVAVLLGAFVIGLYRNHRVTLATAAAAVLLFALTTSLGGERSEPDPVIAARATSLAETPSNPDQSVQSRYGLWYAAVRIWREYPITGAGLKGYVARRDVYRPLNASARSDVEDPAEGFRRIELESPHNLFLLVLSEQGLIGLTTYGLLLVTTLVMGLQNVAARGEGSRKDVYRPFQLALVGWFVSFLVRSLYQDIGGPTVVLEGLLIGAVMSVAFGLREQHG